jgi:hypothetical protein
MSPLSIEKSRNLKIASAKKATAKPNAPSRRTVTAAAVNAKKPPRPLAPKARRIAVAETPVKADEPRLERTTKQERMLTLLCRPEGASIEEMMQATTWRQHSVRGFLAGTVKRKLGFSLTSSKPDDGVRRYQFSSCWCALNQMFVGRV